MTSSIAFKAISTEFFEKGPVERIILEIEEILTKNAPGLLFLIEKIGKSMIYYLHETLKYWNYL